jgi:hypothetical protein
VWGKVIPIEMLFDLEAKVRTMRVHVRLCGEGEGGSYFLLESYSYFSGQLGSWIGLS